MFKKGKLFLILVLLGGLFIPFQSIKAAGVYSVSVMSSNGNEAAIGSYGNYNEAKNVMLNHNSNASNVAVVRKNGKIINAKYAIGRFNYDKGSPMAEDYRNEHRIFPSTTSNTVYTTIHAAYANDVAFIDYDEASDRAKIKISGYTGWTYLSNINIIPISQLQGSTSWVASKDSSWIAETSSNTVKVVSSSPISIRNGHSTSSAIVGGTSPGNTYTFYEKYNDGTYTWYKIGGSPIKTYYENYSTGCLLHYFATHNSQGYTNLGKTPSFLKRGMQYFSFDGNYFYDTLAAMLDDYRYNTHTRAVNQTPYYPYYLYLPNHTRTRYTGNDFNQIIKNLGYTNNTQSKMYGEGDNFILSQEKYGVNALLTFSAAMNESASGTSAIARNKNNLFGHNAFGSDPYNNATTYPNVAAGIMEHGRMTGTGYNNPSDSRYYGGHYGNKGSGMNVYYATDAYWGEKAAMNAFTKDNGFGLQDWKGNTIGIKTSNAWVPIKKKPSYGSSTIYDLNNRHYAVSDMPVVVTDKVYSEGVNWYKVYTDAALNDNQDIANIDYSFNKSYGYIEEKYLFVENKQPTIIASDRTITIGSSVDLMAGVIATDSEDGTITSNVKISGTVYNNIPGTYQITYTVFDNQQFSVSKKVNVIVKGESVPIITANDKTVTQYTNFSPNEGVTASDSIDKDITSKIQVVSNTVNINVIGNYKVKYKVTNSTGKSTEKEINVTVGPNEKPVITTPDKSIAINSTFNPLEGVSASDKEDGRITKIEVTENTVNNSKIGTYKVTYKVTDSAGQITIKSIFVSVEEKVLIEKEGWFHLEKFNINNDTLSMSGFAAIKNMDNKTTDSISYKLIFVEQNTGARKEYNVSRWTTGVPYKISDGSSFDYTGSWYQVNTDITSLPQGDYTMYIRAVKGDYSSTQLVSNIEYTDGITRKYKDSNNKGYAIRENNVDARIPLEMFVRNDGLISYSNTPVPNSMYNYFYDYAFINNTLTLSGTSYILRADYGTDKKVDREIILENLDTHKIVYRKQIGAITNGPYKIVSNEGKNMTQAWFNGSIDLQIVPKGTYAIYIRTSADKIEDYNELVDYAYSDLSKTSTINGNKASLRRVDDKRLRIELVIK